MKKKDKKNKKVSVENFFPEKRSIKIDLGSGATKMGPDWVGVDIRKEPGVDIVQDLSKFPWRNIPDNCASIVRCSHVWEHINPASSDPRLAGLINLLLTKKVITKAEIDEYVGDYEFLGGFIRFMDEVWRVLKPGGQFQSVFPMAASKGYWQDPTHVNAINEITLAYFDPLATNPQGLLYNLYGFYRPKPWKIVGCAYELNGFMEVAMDKRLVDKSYNVSKEGNINL